MPETLTDTGVYEIWVCKECCTHCIFIRPPKKGEICFDCWKGEIQFITNPPPVEKE